MRRCIITYKMAGDGDREMVLANFQSITGIENLDECITLLDHHDWDLAACVNSVMADETDSPLRLPVTVPVDDFPAVIAQSSVPSVASVSVDNVGRSFPPQNPPRRVKFLIEWKEHTIPVVLDDTETLGSIKRMLEMQLDIPVNQQSLLGWPNHLQLNDDSVLSTLNLREETALVLVSRTVTKTPKERQPCAVREPCSASKSNNSLEKIMLNIQCESREFNLPYAVTKTIGEVKADIYSLSGVPCRYQCWTGWPVNVTDDMHLQDVNLSFPVHNLTVRRNENDKAPDCIKASSSKTRHVDVEMDADDESSDNEDTSFQVDDDEMFYDTPASRRQITTMLENDCLDTAENLVKFTTEFEERYGEVHPHFYMGPLTEAITESGGASAKERRPLIIYLHHDGSILTNVFCSQLICSETIVNYISSNFVVWAWDMTHDTNSARFVEMVTQHFGRVAASTLGGFGVEQYPLLIVGLKNRSAMEICSVIQGSVTLDELMTGLMSAHDTFQQAMDIEIREEEEREARELVKREQDEAYQASLRQDRAKAEEKKRQEEEEILSKKLHEEQALHEAQLKEAQRLSLMDHLPSEPGSECTTPVSNFRFRLPNGDTVTRRFLATNPLQCVLTFVQTKGFLDSEYKVVTNFPRRNLSALDPTESLQSLGLYPQETIFVEER
ncbi:PREDICTED: FAS-associated factor 1-like [Acropora digitifera]|uniref:FAS-associated factor 1-like n=1 Tax=Acropora digitifera TaxID=70779 RepID=UPI000779F90A|nr:PREDICTED: FAS-associated factor 1-like [Acropora digitifera]